MPTAAADVNAMSIRLRVAQISAFLAVGSALAAVAVGGFSQRAALVTAGILLAPMSAFALADPTREFTTAAARVRSPWLRFGFGTLGLAVSALFVLGGLFLPTKPGLLVP